MNILKYIGIVLLGLLGVVVTITALNYFGLTQYRFFAPKFENARREVFESTRSYNEGKVQDLVKYRLEYMRASDEDKKAIKSTIQMMFANYPTDRLPLELRSFMNEINRGY